MCLRVVSQYSGLMGEYHLLVTTMSRLANAVSKVFREIKWLFRRLTKPSEAITCHLSRISTCSSEVETKSDNRDRVHQCFKEGLYRVPFIMTAGRWCRWERPFVAFQIAPLTGVNGDPGIKSVRV